MKHIFVPILFMFLVSVGCIKVNLSKEGNKATMEELDARYKSYWDSAKYNTANSAINAAYLTLVEQKVYYYLNLAHLNPQLFAATYADGYEGANGIANNADFESNKKSLIEDLKRMSALPILIPDSNMYVLAKCHGISIGLKGLVTHDRSVSGCPDGYSAECIAFGDENSLDIVMALLIDAGVSSLGHRMICLGNYRSMGVSVQYHSSYKKCAVLDFLR